MENPQTFTADLGADRGASGVSLHRVSPGRLKSKESKKESKEEAAMKTRWNRIMERAAVAGVIFGLSTVGLAPAQESPSKCARSWR